VTAPGIAACTARAVYSFRSGRYEKLTDVGEWPVWRPDSRRVLFVVNGKEFRVVDAMTKRVRTIYSTTRDVIGPPRLSRDGRSLFFTRRVTEAESGSWCGTRWHSVARTRAHPPATMYPASSAFSITGRLIGSSRCGPRSRCSR
jgi:hypothetical protein